MRERINRLAKGIIDMEAPVLSIQPDRIDEEITVGELIRDELFISSDNGLHSKGLVYSSNSRVRVLNGAFGGLRNHIGYEINSRYLEYGDVIEGSFYLVTNGGGSLFFSCSGRSVWKDLGAVKGPYGFCQDGKTGL